ncbi:hypothetical protein EmuJ_000986300 [Echinococcus multilocularis]|uniref:Uncharacterized protein n=1 Tax=Echinococcus multilocularis TaxID=6211 RepID=A0A068YFQ2_ECHMU|nr:hypothetical protein EmuJ_000986300 [Echinococcus multilocularis]
MPPLDTKKHVLLVQFTRRFADLCAAMADGTADISIAGGGEDDEIAEFYGLGRHFCDLPTDEAAYRIAILVPFDPTLGDISAAVPQLQVALSYLSRVILDCGLTCGVAPL